jgi:hypothetical protein
VEDELTIQDLDAIDRRVRAVDSMLPPPWIPWLETRGAACGCGFIQFGDPDRDDQIYARLIYDNQRAISPDP